MDMNNVRRVSSAGYRLPERARPKTTEPPADRGRLGTGAAGPGERNPERRDPVKQDQKNWNFLRDYDQMGRLKPEEPLPSNVPLFSERVPNTTNQMFGSRLSTPLGRNLVQLDRLLLWSGSNHRCKLDPEMLPC
ncbi:hypothetical protein JOQ06_029261 [Pogonophryne albipinna]|uniref:Uncharacterized protein n=1 Tax=Pogonophryne albipinna TaxID=1090488 RepID=A0AAD6FLI0_9TELE|nr:hypothetical protein JOQ06_029261 [Pogonophryne albipinna]